MKAYITCPVTHSRKRLDFLRAVKKVVEESGMETFVFEIGGEPKNIFRDDYNEIESSDIIIADVSEPSHGVGIEIGLSYCLGLKRILLVEKGKKVSAMARGIPETTLIEYENEKELIDKLCLIFKKL